jgi:hypothetical protein
MQWLLFVRVVPDLNWHSSVAALGSNTTAAFLPTLMLILHGKQCVDSKIAFVHMHAH